MFEKRPKPWYRFSLHLVARLILVIYNIHKFESIPFSRILKVITFSNLLNLVIADECLTIFCVI